MTREQRRHARSCFKLPGMLSTVDIPRSCRRPRDVAWSEKGSNPTVSELVVSDILMSARTAEDIDGAYYILFLIAPWSSRYFTFIVYDIWSRYFLVYFTGYGVPTQMKQNSSDHFSHLHLHRPGAI